MTDTELKQRLQAAADEKFKAFNEKIVCSSLPMLGVRTPVLHALGKEIARDPYPFWQTYAPCSYEDVLVYALTVAYAKLPLAEKYPYIDRMLGLFDNWAHVDVTLGAFKQLGRCRDEFLRDYRRLAGDSEFKRRFLVVFLMNYCLTDDMLDEVFALYAQMQCDMYYVNMGIAWGLSVALVKFYDRTLAFLRRGSMSDWITKKTVQKARESYRLSQAQKEELRTLLPVRKNI